MPWQLPDPSKLSRMVNQHNSCVSNRNNYVTSGFIWFFGLFGFWFFWFFFVLVYFLYSSSAVTLPPRPNPSLQDSHRRWKAAVFPHVSWHLTTSPSAKQWVARCLISGSKIQLLFKLPMDFFQATAQIKLVSIPFPTTSFPSRVVASSFFLNFYIVL